MKDIADFLRNSVFYPGSGFDWTPVKNLAGRFQNFLYADIGRTREDFEAQVRQPEIYGYQLADIQDLSPELLFGKTWQALKCLNEDTLTRPIAQNHWNNPYAVLCRFEKQRSNHSSPATQPIHLMYTRFESIATFRYAFCQRNIVPKCLVCICPVGYGAYVDDFPRLFSQALRFNLGGLPRYVLYEPCFDTEGEPQLEGVNPNILAEYSPLKSSRSLPGRLMPGDLTFAKLKPGYIRATCTDDRGIKSSTRAFLNSCVVGTYEMDVDGRVSVDGTVVITQPIKKLPVAFSRVTGDFRLCGGTLETLEGCPDFVGGNFDCSHNLLTSLMHGPSECRGNFICTKNSGLSLQGVPEMTASQMVLDSHVFKNPATSPQELFRIFQRIHGCQFRVLSEEEGSQGWSDPLSFSDLYEHHLIELPDKPSLGDHCRVM